MREILAIVIFCGILVVGAQVPDGYYDGATGTGFDLKTQLHNRIKQGHTSQGYSALWDFYEAHALDSYYENDGTILDMYSENPTGSDPYNFIKVSDQCGNYSSEGDCYNREHTFPRSWFGGSQDPMNSDVHMVMPSDGKVNGMRASFPYGEVASASQTSRNGSKLGSGTGSQGYTGTVFEPIDEFKGDVARIYFYMATRYEDVIAGWENNTSDANAVLNGSSDKVFEDWSLDLLIKWHKDDPVSQKEIDWNDNAYDHQGNRNPFIDHPEWVDAIWNPSAPVVDLSLSTPSLNFGKVQIGDFNTQPLILNGENLNESVQVAISGDYAVGTEEDGPFISGLQLTNDGTIRDMSLYVRFSPSMEGQRSGTLTVSSSGETVHASLTGEGEQVITRSPRKAEIKIYPNPVDGVLRIENLPKGFSVRIFDNLGRRMPVRKVDSGLDVSDFDRGQYFLTVSTSKPKIFKFLVN